MFLKNDRELGVKNGRSEPSPSKQGCDARGAGRAAGGRSVSPSSDYAALDYGYAATVHKAQGATVDRSFVLATPGMDRHLAYVGMTRHREGVEVYAGRDDFKGFEEFKERLSRARPKDSTLDYAQRRGWRPPAPSERNKERPARQQENQRPEREAEGTGSGTQAGSRAGRSGRALQAGAKGVHPGGRRRRLRSQGQGAHRRAARGDETRLPGNRQDPARMRAAEREGFAPQIKNFVRQTEKEHGRDKGRDLGKDRDFDMER